MLTKSLDETVSSMSLKDLTLTAWAMGVSNNKDKSFWQNAEYRIQELLLDCQKSDILKLSYAFSVVDRGSNELW